jgi:hypothetical protein
MRREGNGLEYLGDDVEQLLTYSLVLNALFEHFCMHYHQHSQCLVTVPGAMTAGKFRH